MLCPEVSIGSTMLWISGLENDLFNKNLVMKKKNLFSFAEPVLLTLLSMTMLLLFNNCERIELEADSSDFDITKMDLSLFSYSSELESYFVPKEDVRNTIVAYLEGRRNTESRTTNMTTAEAIWYIETLPNYYRGNAATTYKQLKVGKYYVYLTNDANAVFTEAQVNEKTAEIEAYVLAEINAVPYDASLKNTIVVDVRPLTDASGNVVLETTIGTGIKVLPTDDPTDPEPIAPYDPCDLASSTVSWHAIGYEGICENQNAPFANAAEKLQSVLNSYDDDIGCAAFRLTYPLTDNPFFANIRWSTPIYPVQYEWELANPDDDDPIDGYKDFYLFYTASGYPVGYIDCLSPTEMQYYLFGAGRVIEWYMTTKKPGKDFILCDMYGDFIIYLGDATHAMQIQYGEYIP